MPPTNSPWKDIRSLDTLMNYWKEHKEDFEDPDRRNNALAAVALEIKEASGEDISPSQIMTKFTKMWERKRAAKYAKLSGGIKKLFELGPQCLDRSALGLDVAKPNDSGPASRGENGQHELVMRPKTKALLEEKLNLLGRSDGESIQSLEEQLFQMKEENNILKETVQARDSEIQVLKQSKYVHEQIFSSEIKDRGPHDKQVKDQIQKIISLIRLNTDAPSGDNFAEGPLLLFSKMKGCYKHLYHLHQQAYCLGLDDNITLMRLRCLGFQEVKKSYMMRALIGMEILQTVFRSSFPDFYHDRGSAALLYEQLIESQAGTVARVVFTQCAQHTYVKSQKFLDRIVPAKAISLAETLNDLLLPLRDIAASDGSPQSPDVWKSQEETLQDVFVQSLILRAELRLNLDRYEFFWPAPNTQFSKVTMTSDNADSDAGLSEEAKVTITLFPGIHAWDPEAIARQGNSDADRDDGCRVVVKALVITH